MRVYDLIEMLEKTDPAMEVQIYDMDLEDYRPVTGMLSDTRDMTVWLFSDDDDTDDDDDVVVLDDAGLSD